jgi:hypothetical protein
MTQMDLRRQLLAQIESNAQRIQAESERVEQQAAEQAALAFQYSSAKHAAFVEHEMQSRQRMRRPEEQLD